MEIEGEVNRYSDNLANSYLFFLVCCKSLLFPCKRTCMCSVPALSWGFAKSRPAAQRPAAHGPRRPSGPAARRPIGRPGGPAARWPSPDFPQSFCPAVNPRTCTDLHRVWACKMDDGEFEFVYHFNNHFNPIRPFLSLHVAK